MQHCVLIKYRWNRKNRYVLLPQNYQIALHFFEMRTAQLFWRQKLRFCTVSQSQLKKNLMKTNSAVFRKWRWRFISWEMTKFLTCCFINLLLIVICNILNVRWIYQYLRYFSKILLLACTSLILLLKLKFVTSHVD